MLERELFPSGKLTATMMRLSRELIENHGDFSASCLIGLQPRGIYFARRMREVLQTALSDASLLYGEIDVTFHRDDIRRYAYPLAPSATCLDFSIESKRVVLIDDVLYTGRTVRSALDALLSYGRPKDVELLVLIDRKRKRELPIEARYVGIAVDTLDSEKAIVRWQEQFGMDRTIIQSAY